MKLTKLAAAVCALSLGVAFGAQAASPGAAQAASKYSPRGQLVYQIVEKWAPYVQEAHNVDAKTWARSMQSAFNAASLDSLQQAADARTYNVMAASLTDGKVTPNALGDISTDLVFVPIAPCRVFDTRANGGAPIAAGSTRGIDVSAISDYSFQGGAASNCSGMGAAGSFAAVAMNFTSVAPAQTGYFTAFPFGGTQPLAATQVYNAGQILSNFAVVQLDQGASANEMSIFSERALHLVGDAVGYYINPQATALDCVELDSAVTNLAAGASANVFAPNCAAGYTRTEVQCRPSSFSMRQAGSWSGHCNMVNESASATTATATSRCCRVPGR